MEPLNQKLTESSVATYWVDDDGIVYYNMKPIVIDLEMAKEHFDIIRRLSDNKKGCLIADVTDLKPLQKDVQKYFGEHLPDLAVANAIVSANALGRMIANLFFLLNASKFPMKSFSNADDAKRWISQYLSA
jgi:hypothetical protein